MKEHYNSGLKPHIKSQQDITKLKEAFLEHGNPFADKSEDLMVVNDDNKSNLFKAENTGQQQKDIQKDKDNNKFFFAMFIIIQNKIF